MRAQNHPQKPAATHHMKEWWPTGSAMLLALCFCGCEVAQNVDLNGQRLALILRRRSIVQKKDLGLPGQPDRYRPVQDVSTTGKRSRSNCVIRDVTTALEFEKMIGPT